jgi:hypothetical protein
VRKSAIRLRLYGLLFNMANASYTSYASYVAAAMGVQGPLLGIVSSAGTSLTSIAAYLGGRIRAPPLTIIRIANAALAISLIAMALLMEHPGAYTALYSLSMAALGISSYGLMLLFERHTRGARGSKLADFSFYGALGSLVATLIAGLYMGSDPLLIKMVFLAAAASILASSLLLRGVEGAETVEAGPGRGDIGPLRFYIYFGLFMVVFSSAWPIFSAMQVYVYHMTPLQVAVLNIIAGASTLALQRGVGRLADKNLKALMAAEGPILSSFTLAYALSPNIYPLYAVNVLAGLSNSIYNVAYLAYVADRAEDKRKAIAVLNLVIGVSTLVGSELGSVAYQAWARRDGLDGAGRKLLLIISALRVASALPFLRL